MEKKGEKCINKIHDFPMNVGIVYGILVPTAMYVISPILYLF